jgi:hypothetical protein
VPRHSPLQATCARPRHTETRRPEKRGQTDEWEALEETLEILQDEKALAALRESDEDVEAGRMFSLDEVRRGARACLSSELRDARRRISRHYLRPFAKQSLKRSA